MVKFKREPKRLEVQEIPRAARVIPATEVAIVPRALGYGIVQAGEMWEAVAEVAGKIVEVHPELKKGAFLSRGQVLLRVDPAEYGLAMIRAQAEVENLQAQLKELDQNEKDIHHSLEVEKRSLTLSQKELERKRRLLAKGTISKSELEQEEKRVLAQENTAQNFQSALNLIPSQRKAIQAKIASSRAQLEDTDLDIHKTTITVPFDCRISEVNVELAQYVPIGKVLAKADNISYVEILAQIPIYAFRRLMGPQGIPSTAGKLDMEEIRKMLGFGAVVRLDFGETIAEWQGKFMRTSEMLDPQTRTVGAYVAVNEPYKTIRPGERPPLVKNMFCEVELRGKTREKSMIIPRAALRQGETVYLATNDNRLENRIVEVDFAQGNLIAIKKGLVDGDQVIVSDLIPAIDGTLLKLETDEGLLKSLIAEAKGEVPIK
jgi:RND family efflux transporter MFP subunit